MAQISLSFCELHTPLFLKGSNLGVKLETDKRDIELIYDRAEKEVLVVFKETIAIIPVSNVVSMTPVDAPELIRNCETDEEELRLQIMPKEKRK